MASGPVLLRHPVYCRVFLPVSTGTQIIKIEQVTPELYLETSCTFYGSRCISMDVLNTVVMIAG